jgi:hypothetical protein
MYSSKRQASQQLKEITHFSSLLPKYQLTKHWKTCSISWINPQPNNKYTVLNQKPHCACSFLVPLNWSHNPYASLLPKLFLVSCTNNTNNTANQRGHSRGIKGSKSSLTVAEPAVSGVAGTGADREAHGAPHHPQARRQRWDASAHRHRPIPSPANAAQGLVSNP